MRARAMVWRFAQISRFMGAAAGLALVVPQMANAQFVFSPSKLIDSFENAADVTNYATTGDVIFVDPGGLGHAVQTTRGVTRGSSAMQVETEGAFDLNDGEDFFGWGAIGGLAVAGNYMSGPAFDAFQLAAQNPDAWELVFDLSSDADSWLEAPAPSTSTSNPGDIGPSRSGSRVQIAYDSVQGTPFNTGSIHGTTGRLTVKVPFKSLYDSANPAPTTGAAQWTVQFGADNNRFNPEDPLPNGGAKHYIDNVRLKPRAPVVPDVVWNFETDATTFQGWSDTGNSGTDTSHKHSIVTGLGATKQNATTGAWEPDAAGHGLLIDTSNIAPGVNGFQWGTAMVLNADADRNGAVDNPAAKTKIQDIVSRMRKSDAIAFDITYHDSTARPAGLPTPVVPDEPNAPWLKMVLGIWTDPTPADGVPPVPNEGLTQFQFDNEFGTDVLGNSVQTSRGDYAGILTTEFIPDGLIPDEPLTMTIQFAQLGNLLSILSGTTFDNSNYLRFSFAVQTGTGDNTILAVVDNIRFLHTVSLDGDYDHDGDVDAADRTAWNAQNGSTNENSDGDENGLVDGNDILIWQKNLGNDATPALAAAGAVPEPASAVLVVTGALLLAARRRRA